MHCLVIGETGQLARGLAAELQTGLHTATFLSRRQCDLSETDSKIRAAIAPHLDRADVVIIAAAYTAVDQAEADYDTALAVNGRAPGVIAEEAAKAGCPVVHISTDYVFNGEAGTPYRPDAPTDPINAYGRSKAAGEWAVLQAQPRSAILRTSWLFDGNSRNFLTTMLRLGQSRRSLDVVADQDGRPTYARDLAAACLLTADALVKGREPAAGLFHVTNSGNPISWASFARAIFAATAGERDHSVVVSDIRSAEFPTAAARPAYSVLDISRFEQTFDFVLPDWQSGLRRALADRPAS